MAKENASAKDGEIGDLQAKLASEKVSLFFCCVWDIL
jgi:hypothetical protein